MTLRVLIAVTHLLGAGHLVRASAIGRALARRGHRVTLVSGGTPTRIADGGGMELVQLPPLRSPVGDFSNLLGEDGMPASPAYIDGRRRQLLATFARARPDVVVTEQFPFGRRSLAGEFQALLDAVAAADPAPLLLASIRDILVAPTKADRIERTHALVARRYNAVLVHSDERTVPLERSWPVDAELRRRLIYTGYVGPDADEKPCSGGEADGAILVSGGSSAAGLPLHQAALAAARMAPPRPWRLLVGAAVDEAAFQDLRAEAPPHAVVERARQDIRCLMTRAAVFVGQAGYNTVMDIFATRARSVLVPFEQGRETEQRLRAEALAANGQTVLLPEEALTPASLLGAIEAAEAGPRPAFGVSLRGQDRTARIVEDLVAGRTRSRAGEAAQ